jgi:hypothetical protein
MDPVILLVVGILVAFVIWASGLTRISILRKLNDIHKLLERNEERMDKIISLLDRPEETGEK